MVKTNRIATPAIYRLHPESSLHGRGSGVKKFPCHAISAIHLYPQITVQIHTAGTDKLWSIPASEVAKNDRLIRGLSSEDALLVGVWYGEAKSRRLYQELTELRDNEAGSQAKVTHYRRIRTGVIPHTSSHALP